MEEGELQDGVEENSIVANDDNEVSESHVSTVPQCAACLCTSTTPNHRCMLFT